jgi:antitoxin component of RelBE/YafQ-DinJ toxin-antitoxin module
MYIINIINIILAEGHRVIYDREVPFELRIHDNDTGP